MSRTLDELRKEIDAIDSEIVSLLAKRMDVVRHVGEIKKLEGSEVLVPDRWRKVLESKIEQAKKHGMSEEFIKDLYNLIHEYSLKVQKDLGATGKR